MKSESALPISVRKTENYMDQDGYARSREVTLLEGGMNLRDYAEIQFITAILSISHDPSCRNAVEVDVDWGIKTTDEWLKRREERKC